MKVSAHRLLFATGLLSAILVAATFSVHVAAQDVGVERGRMKDILNVVANEVQKNFYDPSLKGLDWKALTEQARARIDRANSPGEMVTAITAMVNKLDDSHTIFLPPMRTVRPIFGFEAQAVGDKILVYELKNNGGAAKAGLQLGDEVVAVNGYNALRDNWDLMMLFFHALRPIPAFDLTIARGNEAPKTLHVQAELKERPITTNVLEHFWDLIRESEGEIKYKYQNYPDGVGYVHLPSFEGTEEFLGILMKKIDGSKAVIVDLRGNRGGALTLLTNFSGYFDSQPTVMAQVISRKKTEDLKIKPNKRNFSGPMLILLDARSASASEAFARHFQLTKHAVVIGDRSSGKLNVARVFSESHGAGNAVFYGVEVSVGRFVFPGGEEVEKKGVLPDQVCLPTGEDLRKESDPCLQQAVAMARKGLGLSPAEKALDKPKEKKSAEDVDLDQ